MDVISRARFVRTTPDKLRILVSMLKSKTVNKAIDQLRFSPKDASKYIILVLKQIKAQAKDLNLNEEALTVKNILIDEGPKLKRRRICHQGRSTMILKRMSHITVIANDDTVKKTTVNASKEKEIAKAEKR